MTNDDKWINVDPRTKKLSIRFCVRGCHRSAIVNHELQTGVNFSRIMFGFNGSSEGIEGILEQISSNDKNEKLTHKEVRAYARCLLILVPNLNLSPRLENEINALLSSLSLYGLPHYDRSFLALKILEMLKNARTEIKDNSEVF